MTTSGECSWETAGDLPGRQLPPVPLWAQALSWRLARDRCLGACGPSLVPPPGCAVLVWWVWVSVGRCPLVPGVCAADALKQHKLPHPQSFLLERRVAPAVHSHVEHFLVDTDEIRPRALLSVRDSERCPSSPEGGVGFADFSFSVTPEVMSSSSLQSACSQRASFLCKQP